LLNIKRQNIVIFFSIIGLFILAIFITIVLRQFRQKKEANTKLENQNQEIILQSEELKKLNKDKDRFISILAHDLKNPFNSLLGFSSLLLSNLHIYDKQEIRDQIKVIHLVSHNAYQLLEQILLWANSQSGKLIIEPQLFNFKEITTEVIGMLENQANEKNIKIQLIENENMVMNADLNIYKAVIRNLISNSIKFTHKGGLINIHAEDNKSFTVITVSDNGVGIEKENIPKLWEIDDSYSTIGTNNEKGTGFGLKLCKELVKKHGGTIWVESETGKGSHFSFTLPVIKNN